MTGITRRDLLALGAAALGASTVPIIGARAQTAAPSDVPMADVKPPDLPIEKGATLKVLRPAKFIDPDQVWWDKNTQKFTETTGIPVTVNYLSWEDLAPQTAVIANTGAGPDIVIGFSISPFIYTDKLVRMDIVADSSARNTAAGSILRCSTDANGRPTTGSACRSVAALGRRCIARPG